MTKFVSLICLLSLSTVTIAVDISKADINGTWKLTKKSLMSNPDIVINDLQQHDYTTYKIDNNNIEIANVYYNDVTVVSRIENIQLFNNRISFQDDFYTTKVHRVGMPTANTMILEDENYQLWFERSY